MTDPSAPRGTPPSTKELARDLGPRLPLWDGTVEMGKEFGATWRWAHSDVTGAWSYRAYLPGERFFVALSIVPTGLEVSFNLKTEEWEYILGEGATEQAYLDALRDKALATGDDPAWLHVPLDDIGVMPALAKLLFGRARRVQPPRTKKRKR